MGVAVVLLILVVLDTFLTGVLMMAWAEQGRVTRQMAADIETLADALDEDEAEA